MNITRILPLRAFLLITLLILFACLTYGTEGRPPVVHIVRNVAWNDFISQIKILSTKNCSLFRSFSRRTKPKSESESTTSKYSRPLTKHERVYRRPTRIWKRSETNCPTRKNKQGWGGDLWNSGQSPFAASVSNPLSRDKVSVTSASRFPARRVTTSSTAGFEPETVGTIS